MNNKLPPQEPMVIIPTKCFKLILGPLGTIVGSCELEFGHEGPCRVNGVSEQDMVDTLTGLES